MKYNNISVALFIDYRLTDIDEFVLSEDIGLLRQEIDEYSEIISETMIFTNKKLRDMEFLIEEDDNEDEFCKLILIKAPKNRARDLRKIEETFDIAYRAFEILKGYKNVPFTLSDNILIDGALEKIHSLGELGNLLTI